jgi:hypothetical protein
MFGLRRKIGTGAPSRRRPARECKVGIEGLETRAVPGNVVSTPGGYKVEGLETRAVPGTLVVSTLPTWPQWDFTYSTTSTDPYPLPPIDPQVPA